MNDTKSKLESVSEFVLEIRYAPNPKVLDYRGTWVEMVSKHLEMKEWRISENRFDAFDKDNNRRAFVSWRNAGFIVRDSPTKNFFPDQASKHLRFLFNQEPFGDPITIQRIGIRSRFATTFEGNFSELVELYATKFLVLSSEAEKAFGAELEDIGGPLDFETKNGHIRSVSGPMEGEQVKDFFKFVEEPPDVSLYVDLDYFSYPEKMMGSKKVIETLRLFADENWDRHNKIKAVIFGE